ncbi:hypothetical protein GCM10022215_18010 [Nocardioides fonticola]|uniref:Phage tail protein n=1 Tax=Nocardioides fonticola TaxID=450363 RepID=A0ABP7XIU9_9ACTN
MSTQQQWQITGTVDRIALGVFDTKSGGDPSAEVTKYRPGGMSKEVAFAALPSFSDLTIGRLFTRERDVELYRRLVGLMGRGEASITAQPLDVNGAPFGRPFTYTGVLQSGTDPEVDSQSGTPNTFSLVFTITDRT